MEQPISPEDPSTDRKFRMVHVTIEVSVMSWDEEDAMSAAWREVEAIAKKNAWNIVNTDCVE
jgi:hypothetical protein